MEHHSQALVGDRLGGFVQCADDIRFVGGKVILGAFDRVRPEDKNAAVVFFDQFRPGKGLIHLFFPLGGVSQVQGAVTGDER